MLIATIMKRIMQITLVLGMIATLIAPAALRANSTPDQTQASILQRIAGPGFAAVVTHPDGSLCFKQGFGCLSAAQTFPTSPTPVRAYRFNGGGSGGVVAVFLVLHSQQIRVGGDRLILRLLQNGDIQVRDSGGCHSCDASVLVATYRVVDRRLVVEPPAYPDAETRANAQMQKGYSLDEKCQEGRSAPYSERFSAAKACTAAGANYLALARSGGSNAKSFLLQAAGDLLTAAGIGYATFTEDVAGNNLAHAQALQAQQIFDGYSPNKVEAVQVALERQEAHLLLIPFSSNEPSPAAVKVEGARCISEARKNRRSYTPNVVDDQQDMATSIACTQAAYDSMNAEINRSTRLADTPAKERNAEDAAWYFMIAATSSNTSVGDDFAQDQLQAARSLLVRGTQPENPSPRAMKLMRAYRQLMKMMHYPK